MCLRDIPPYSFLHFTLGSYGENMEDESQIGVNDYERRVRDAKKLQKEILPVRNNVAVPGNEVAVLHHWRVKKGVYDEFRRLSEEGVWPFFEKIGARVVGMWQVIHPEIVGGGADDDFDEVYLLTRYASVEHWKATRKAAKLGGNGPDWEKCMKALDKRHSLSFETSAQFLQGGLAPNGPYYMPALDEKYIKNT
jgi:hypothetical protein